MLSCCWLLLLIGIHRFSKNPTGCGYGGDLDPAAGMWAGGGGGAKGRVQVWGSQTWPQTRRVPSVGPTSGPRTGVNHHEL
jgi:hypothetical protein